MITNDLTLDKPLPLPTSVKTTPPRVARALEAFEEAVGGREALVAELLASVESENETVLVNLLADPEQDSRPLHEILSYGNFSVARFLRLFKTARGARAYLDALDKVWSKLPDVAEDVMSKALPQSVRCKPCEGTGFQAITGKHNFKKRGPVKERMQKVICDSCEGTGKRKIEPTLDYQVLALKIGGLPKPDPKVTVDQSSTRVTQNNYGDSAMKDFISAVQRVKSANLQDIKVVDAEVLQESEEVK
jgi:hypothetical protein